VRRLTIVAILLLAGALLGGRAEADRATSFCTGSQLTGAFTAVPGSAGAGNIVYKLVVRNRSATTCAVSGLPNVTLLGRHGKKLPTHVRAAMPNLLTAVLVRLSHGEAATATARFSPDIPGPGEQTLGACEAKAFTMAVHAPGGGTTVVPVAPPTPVCEHGQLQFRAFALAH
jgi:Protein of unknown function (DUF4232)